MPTNVAIALAAAALTVAVPVNANAEARQPQGKVVVFVTEGSDVSLAGTRLKEYDASTACQAFPLGAHVISNLTDRRLLIYGDPACVFPAPPPFNFISPGYGAHVSPTGGFRVR